MIYGKLAVVMLNSIAAEKADSTNSIIAQWLLAHQKEMKTMTIQEAAKGAHVGIASVSRFVRELGFEDFRELRELLTSGMDPFERVEGDIPSVLMNEITAGLESVRLTLDMNGVEKLVKAIGKREKIWIFSLLKGQAAATALSADLNMLGKHSRTLFTYKEQIEVLKNCSKDDLIILFSYTGDYFSYEERIPRKNEIKAPIVMVSGGTNHNRDLIDLFIPFSCRRTQLNHPYTMIYAAGIIAQKYAERLQQMQ